MFRAAVYCEEVRVMDKDGSANNVGNNHKKEPSNLPKYYLILYNFLQTIGWTVLLFQLVQYYITPSINSRTTLYDHVKWTLIVFQNAAVLEVLHAVFKLVQSSPIITIQQVASRVILVCGVLIPFLSARDSYGLPLALIAWSITEIVRYSNYMLNLMKAVPFFLVWLRYSTFIILYPIGVTGELLCLYSAQKEARESGQFSIYMPNPFNTLFYYDYFLIVVMLAYIPLFPQLYLHMFGQRKKVLGPPRKVENGVQKKVK